MAYENNLPSSFELFQNYPNPFNPETTIKFQLSELAFVSLKVYDALGREVAILVNGFRQPGIYHSQFSIFHSQLSSGIYYYRLQAGDYTASKKMILTK